MVRRIIHADEGKDREGDPSSAIPAWRRSALLSSANAAISQPTATSGSLADVISAERLANAEAELAVQLANAAGRIQALDAALRTIGPRDLLAAQQRRSKTHFEVTQQRQAAAGQLRDDSRKSAQGALGRIDEFLAAVSREPAGSWESLHCRATADVPTMMRYGSMLLQGVQVPAVAPLIETSGWFVQATGEWGADLALSVLTRLAASVPLGHLTVEVFDPRMRGLAGHFAALRSTFGSGFQPSTSDAATFAQRLARVMESAAGNVEHAGPAGCSHLTELWRRTGTPVGRVNLVVILDYPFSIDEQINERLAQMASFSGPSGTSLLVIADGQTPPAIGVLPAKLAAKLRVFRNEGASWVNPDLPVVATADPTPPAEVLRRVLQEGLEAVGAMQGPTVCLSELIADDFERPWTASSQKGLDIAIGRLSLQGGPPLEISLRSSNPPHPNLLIGGAVGQGKSNLLLDIVYAMSAKYSPDEVELHLLDFKQGLEFKAFDADESGENWLPHARVLCLESSPAFGIAALEYVEAEMARRALLFKAVPAADIDEYRTRTASKMARIVLMIDEFHVLFDGQENEVEKAVGLLTHVAKQGRAYGIHLILATQTTTGVQALAVKGDAIFAQFPLRMSLKNTVEESQAILSQGNKAAADLNYRGEVILNRNYGHDPAGFNVRGIAAHARSDETRTLQRKLWRRGHGEAPMMFLGGSYADYRHLAAPNGADPDGIPLWVGRPIAVGNSVREIRLIDDVDQGVAVVGSNAELAVAVLRSMIASAIAGLREAGGRIVVLNASNLREEGAPLRQTLGEAQAAGVAFQTVAREQIAAFVFDELQARIAAEQEPPWLVVALGLQRARGMSESRGTAASSEEGFDWGFRDSRNQTARDVLVDVARKGALSGVFLLGWWPNLRALREDLPGAVGVSSFVTADLGREDIRDLVGALAPRVDGSPRVGLYQVTSEASLEVLVPFDPKKGVQAH